ncbi:unnamed protein product [Protopolystoma xenopodis]|uniref:Uncharacterized protein n=1 Tax=Protopolystoma xenopodis TaxID=117903 RepID=A0A3S5CMV2_9PLAT|nr:unnamed protein product [Protopolystoma xenopodis]
MDCFLTEFIGSVAKGDVGDEGFCSFDTVRSIIQHVIMIYADAIPLDVIHTSITTYHASTFTVGSDTKLQLYFVGSVSKVKARAVTGGIMRDNSEGGERRD